MGGCDWTIAVVLAMDNDVDKFGVESMFESLLKYIYLIATYTKRDSVP